MEVVDNYIEGDSKLIFRCIDSLKMFRCKWNPEVKKWKASDETRHRNNLDMFISRMNEEEIKETERKIKLWQTVCKNLKFDYVKKGTPEYELVKADYIKLLKSNYNY